MFGKILNWLFPPKARITLAERKKMLKRESKNELVRMLLKNELVIAKIMAKYKITDLKQFR